MGSRGSKAKASAKSLRLQVRRFLAHETFANARKNGLVRESPLTLLEFHRPILGRRRVRASGAAQSSVLQGRGERRDANREIVDGSRIRSKARDTRLLYLAAAATTMVPLMLFPWISQWYLNSPSLSNLTGFDDCPGSISPVLKVLPSSSEIAVCFE